MLMVVNDVKIIVYGWFIFSTVYNSPFVYSSCPPTYTSDDLASPHLFKPFTIRIKFLSPSRKRAQATIVLQIRKCI